MVSERKVPPVHSSSMRRVLAVIPARGGSKGITRKNLRRVGGITLVERAVQACSACAVIDSVAVSTDDDEIAAAATRSGAQVVLRPAELASDTASSESALLHALGALDPEETVEILVFVQCTSPFISPDDLAAGVQLIDRGDADTVFSAKSTFDFLWRETPGGFTGVNHDPARRLRRQEATPNWVESGAFYVVNAGKFRKIKHRFFGKIGLVVTDPETAIDIDDEPDLSLANYLADSIVNPNVLPPGLEHVNTLVTDFDGVHTDDQVLLDELGFEMVRVSRSDGLGISLLKRAGFNILILSSERNPVVSRRADKLGVECIQHSGDKKHDLMSWLLDKGIDPKDAMYLGNDVNDLDPMSLVGWPVAVSDAHSEVKEAAKIITNRPGGSGAVREVADLLLRANL